MAELRPRTLWLKSRCAKDQPPLFSATFLESASAQCLINARLDVVPQLLCDENLHRVSEPREGKVQLPQPRLDFGRITPTTVTSGGINAFLQAIKKGMLGGGERMQVLAHRPPLWPVATAARCTSRCPTTRYGRTSWPVCRTSRRPSRSSLAEWSSAATTNVAALSRSKCD